MSKVLLIYTGGTIGMVKEYHTNSLMPFNFDNIYTRLPELKQLNCTIDSISFEIPLDSSNISPTDWVTLVAIIEKNYQTYDGFVILHGTDTMSYTASALSFMLLAIQKPIIFTGSQLPIGDIRTDAKENLITSIYLASRSAKESIAKEVMIYFEYKLYRANRTTKYSANDFDAFKSPNYPYLLESGVALKINHQHTLQVSSKLPVQFIKHVETQVVILKIFPGIMPIVVKQILSIPGLKGVLLETYGAGNALNADWFINLLTEAIAKGICIVNVSQCLSGAVNQNMYVVGRKLAEIGVIGANEMTSESALTKMMVGLGKYNLLEEFKEYFLKNISGEISNE